VKPPFEGDDERNEPAIEPKVRYREKYQSGQDLVYRNRLFDERRDLSNKKKQMSG
jgi:hypothetical protein